MKILRGVQLRKNHFYKFKATSDSTSIQHTVIPSPIFSFCIHVYDILKHPYLTRFVLSRCIHKFENQRT